MYVEDNNRIIFLGWYPVINDQVHEEIFSTRKDALKRGKQISDLLEMKGVYNNKVSTKFIQHTVSYKDVSRHISREDFDNAITGGE